MNIKEKIAAFVKVAERIEGFLAAFYDDENQEFPATLQKARDKNPWFTFEEQKRALRGIVHLLDEDKLLKWTASYPGTENTKNPKTAGVIMAGNIPMVGFHDLLCVLLSGNRLQAKCSGNDAVLLPWFAKMLAEADERFADEITFTERIAGIDAVIATGSNNSARYFEYYFGKYPHVIRKNRNGVAVLTGKENADDLHQLGIDIFSYFGMGCRNVTKLYVPEGYDFNTFYEAMKDFPEVMQHNRYMSNYDYHNALLMMNLEKFLTNNFLILRQQASLSTPVSVVHYEQYDDIKKLEKELHQKKEFIQCIASAYPAEGWIPLGQTQLPGLTDYADGVDTMQFLVEIRNN
jgi:hypothetical protein